MTTSNNNGSVCGSRHRATAVSHFVVKRLTVLALVAFATWLLSTPAAWSQCSWETIWTFTGEAPHDWFGFSVSGAGDVDNDGYADLIVGAFYNGAGGIDAGRAYVYSGQTGALLWTFTGQAAGDKFGFSVSGAGDVNIDGYDDLIVGANLAAGNGKAYVYSGQTGALLWTFTGQAAGDQFGFSVSGAGDVNNDGYDDLIVGAFYNDAGGADAGRAYVYSGQNGALLRTFTGAYAGDQLGRSVSGAGDVNNDGYDDLIVGADFNDAGGSNAGRAYVYSGQTGALLWTFTGESTGDRFGYSVSGAGDVNNDGYADLIVGAIFNEAGGISAGRAYVYSGQTGALLWTFTGEEAYDVLGSSVSGAGDVNNDGYDDLIVGGLTDDPADSGRAYVYSGRSGALLRTFAGEADFDRFGYSVSGAGDVNNDGCDDLIVGAPNNNAGGADAGRAYVFCGREEPPACQVDPASLDFGTVLVGGYLDKTFDITNTGGGTLSGTVSEECTDYSLVGDVTYSLTAGQSKTFTVRFAPVSTGVKFCTIETGNSACADVSCTGTGESGTYLLCFTGQGAGSYFGWSVSGAGDVNSDGYGDLIVGAYGNDAGGTDAGRAYVYSGQDGALLRTFTGEAAGDMFGYSVSGAEDVNSDGYDDLIVGAEGNNAGGVNAGRAYVYSGQNGSLLRTFTGEASNDLFGCSVSGAGDVNNDGYADLIVGAYCNDAGGNNAGRAYVYSGQNGALLWTFTGEAAGDHFGSSVSAAGDVNNDGYDDLIVGAFYNDAGGADAGRAYVYSGQNGALLWTFTGEAAGDWLGYSVSGAGDVNQDGYADLIVGAYGNDGGGNDAGRVYVYSGQNGDLLTTFIGEAADDCFGWSVSGAGDVNNDGYAEVVVGAQWNDAGGVGVGRAYVYSGRSGSLLCTFTGEADFDHFGYSVSGAGDVNNDGYAEVVVGAPYNGAAGTYVGRAYVYGCQVEEPFERGDANGDGLIDVGDVVYLINYLFKSGPVPDPLLAGDANCDSTVDVGDVVYLINYLFKSGPPPPC